MITAEQNEYLTRVAAALIALGKAHKNLSDLWDMEHNFDIDVNAVISKCYPFTQSFDELQSDVDIWVTDATEHIENAMAEYKSSTIFGNGHSTVSGADMDETSDYSGDKDSQVFICNNTGLWIEQQTDGRYFTVAGNDSECGTLVECVTFLRNSGLI